MNTLTHQTTIIEISPDDANNYISKLVRENLGSHQNNPDYLELKVEGKLSIGIKETKDLIKWAQLRPFQSKLKIAVIFDAEKLTTEAQNSLLKLLEEPPKNTYILLVTHNHQTLLQTIRSRATLERIAGKKPSISHSSSETRNILTGNIQTKAKWLDEISKIKESQERRGVIQSFLNEAHEIILQNPDSENTNTNLKLLEKTLTALRNNVNNRLLLENFLFNLVAPSV